MSEGKNGDVQVAAAVGGCRCRLMRGMEEEVNRTNVYSTRMEKNLFRAEDPKKEGLTLKQRVKTTQGLPHSQSSKLADFLVQ